MWKPRRAPSINHQHGIVMARRTRRTRNLRATDGSSLSPRPSFCVRAAFRVRLEMSSLPFSVKLASWRPAPFSSHSAGSLHTLFASLPAAPASLFQNDPGITFSVVTTTTAVLSCSFLSCSFLSCPFLSCPRR